MAGLPKLILADVEIAPIVLWPIKSNPFPDPSGSREDMRDSNFFLAIPVLQRLADAVQ